MKNSKKSKAILQKKLKAKTPKDLGVWEQLTPQKVSPYKSVGSMFSIGNIKNLWKHQRQFASRFFVIMHKNNGMLDLHYVYTHSKKFAYNDGAYLIDKDFMRWSDSLSCFVGEYIEGLSLPVNLEFDEKATIEAVVNDLRGTHVSANVNSKVLLDMVRNEAVQKLIKSEELSKLLQRAFYLGLFNLIAVIGLFAFVGSKLS